MRNVPLKPCEQKPNCVCSLETRPAFAIEPLPWPHRGEPQQMGEPHQGEPMKALLRLLTQFPSAIIVEQTEDYLHAVFTTRLFRWKDDVEFWIDGTNQKIQIRSASRVGYSDLGTNRRRVKKLREAWIRLLQQSLP